MATRLAEEILLALPVGLFAVPTGRTHPRRVAGVDRNNGNTNDHRFVFDESAQLAERPNGKPIPCITTTSRDPFANTSEVFQGNSATGAFGGFDDAFRDDMILVSAESRFLTRQPLQFLLRPLRASTLQPSTLQFVFLPSQFDLLSAMSRSVTICRDIYDAKIDTQNVRRRSRVGAVILHLDVQIETVSSLHQSGTRWPFPGEAGPLKVANNGRQANTANNSGQSESPVRFSKREYLLVVVGARRGKRRLWCHLVCGARPSDCPDRKVGRQSKFDSEGSVDALLDGVLIGCLQFTTGLNRPIARAGKFTKSLFNRHNLIGGWRQFDTDCANNIPHRRNDTTIGEIFNKKVGER